MRVRVRNRDRGRVRVIPWRPILGIGIGFVSGLYLGGQYRGATINGEGKLPLIHIHLARVRGRVTGRGRGRGRNRGRLG